jgi:adenine-specific DNA-methyltransferase
VSRIDYSSLSKEQLIDILKRRDVQAHYGLSWERVNAEADKALNRDFVGLSLDESLSCGPGPWQNLIVEGDNFDALRHLATTHAGQFHAIYIDVPYNTGNKDFVYNDNFFDARNRYRHSTWLEFIYQRLVLARSLLKDSGSIVVSIDDNEVFNLGLLMNQVFGEKCFIANCIWQKRYSRENRSAIGDAHEYLLVYSLDPDGFKNRRGRLALGEKQKSVYKDTGHPRGKWRAVSLSAQGFRPNQMYEIVSPQTGKVFVPPEGGCWKVIRSKFDELSAQGLIYFGKDGNAMPSRMQFLEDIDGMTPWTWWPHEEVGHTDEARKEIQDIFGTQTAFDTPKPTRLMERVLQICAPEKDALVLDFFAGSGTTAHALLKMNKEDGGRRRFVLVSSREATQDNPDKNLCRDVCAVRMRKAIEGYRSARTGVVEPLGGSFAYLKTVTVPMHRLEEGLTDSMVWTFALQACGHPLSPVQSGLSSSVVANHLVAYCTNTKPSTLAALRTLLESHQGPTVVLSWAPQVVQAFLSGLTNVVSYVGVPQDLQRAFRQGNAQVHEPTLVEDEARPVPEPIDGFDDATVDDVDEPGVMDDDGESA